MDYRICSKAVCLRLSKVLGLVTSTDQTCSVPGQSTVSNLTLLLDTLGLRHYIVVQLYVLLLMVTFQIELICVEVFGKVTLCHPCFTSSLLKS